MSLKCTGKKLQNIEEDNISVDNWLPVPVSCQKPETPTESMEFLARAWSLSAKELSKALCNTHDDVAKQPILGSLISNQASLTLESPPESPRGSDDTKELLVLHQALNPEFLSNHQLLRHGIYRSIMKRKSMGRWMKDQKEKKKQEMRAHNAQLHASVSVAGVAAAVAALAAASSDALSSAAALVASHCIEMAEHMGADHDHILSVVNSAINAKTNGDVMTLTAAAATALRGASMLRTRLHNEHGDAIIDLNEENLSINGKQQPNASRALNFVTKGGELLKRTRKGDLHWKQVSFSINSNWQVVSKLKSKHMGGTFTKKKKCVVTGIERDIPAWPGRETEGEQQRSYFAIQTVERVIELECRNSDEMEMWVEGIQHMLNLHQVK